MKIKARTLSVAALLALVCSASVTARAAQDPLDFFSSTRVQTLEGYQKAGLDGESTQVPTMIHALQTHDAADVQKLLLLTLARLGATDALPAINAVIQNKHHPRVAQFAQAARVRLLAQAEATPQAKVERFFQELGENPAQFNAALQDYRARYLADPCTPTPTEMDDLEELADMMYYDSSVAEIIKTLATPIDFNADVNASIKSKLALLMTAQRRVSLVDDLAHVVQPTDFKEYLLLNLGRDEAHQAAEAKLQEMDSDSKSYTPAGFSVLLDLLYLTDDDAHPSPLWDHFRRHADLKVAKAAKMVRTRDDLTRWWTSMYWY